MVASMNSVNLSQSDVAEEGLAFVPDEDLLGVWGLRLIFLQNAAMDSVR